MIRVKKANAEYRVPDEKLEEYLALGYCQIDEHGGLIKESKAQGTAALMAEVERLQAQNAALEAALSPAVPTDAPPPDKTKKQGA